jgi:hypothetical protein
MTVTETRTGCEHVVYTWSQTQLVDWSLPSLDRLSGYHRLRPSLTPTLTSFTLHARRVVATSSPTISTQSGPIKTSRAATGREAAQRLLHPLLATCQCGLVQVWCSTYADVPRCVFFLFTLTAPHALLLTYWECPDARVLQYFQSSGNGS